MACYWAHTWVVLLHPLFQFFRWPVMVTTDVEGIPVSKAGMQRAVLYWFISVWLYFLAICTIWIQVRFGVVDPTAALALSALIGVGTVPVYLLIRFASGLRMPISTLATAQAIHGIFCIALSYAVLGPIRSVALLPLPVIFLLTAFSVSRTVSVQLAAFSVLAVGTAMLWLCVTEPVIYPAATEGMYLIGIANALAVAVFLAEQFNVMRRRLTSQKGELTIALAVVKSLAFFDELTKLPNRRHMKDLLVSEEKRHARENTLLSVALLDVDYFKRVNDRYGHQIGDDTLRKFADLLNASLRTGDVLARWGGEEFLLLLPSTDPDTAVLVVQRLQGCVTEHNLHIGDEFLRITFSAGLAVVLPGGSSSEAVNSADQAMFEAKAAGRNAIRQFVPGAT